MAEFKLRIYPDPVLRGRSAPVADVDAAVRELMDAMADIMYTYDGIGLAAPQVGVLRRVVIADIGEGLLTLANPEVLEEEGQDRLEEGCLSLPEITVHVERSTAILVRGIDADGKEVSLELSGLMARVVLHEIDHLNGVLMIDRASAVERALLNKKLRELAKSQRSGSGALHG